jgi:integrase
MKVDECWERYAAGLNRSKDKGASVWLKRLAPWFAGKNILELTGDVMRAWEAENRRAGYAMATVRLAYDMLAAAINLQIPMIVPALPWGKWRPERESKDERYVPKRPALYSLETLKMLLAEASKDDVRHWRRGRYSVRSRVALFLALSGFRQGEAAGLGWDHVEIDSDVDDENLVFVQYQAARGWRARHTDRPRDEPKDGPRRLSLHPTLVGLLRLHREELKVRGWYRLDGPVWPGPAGRWLETGRVIQPRALKKWAKAANFPQWEKWCAHSLRHTMVCLELRGSGGDVIGTMKRSGHGSVEVIRGYMHSMGGHMPKSSIGMENASTTRLLPSLDSGGIELQPAPQLPQDKTAELHELEKQAFQTVELEREEEKRSKSARSYDSMEEIYRRWEEAGKPGAKPEEIIARARRAYVAGYNEARRSGASLEDCRRSGKMARGQCLGGWGAAVVRFERMARLPAVTATQAIALLGDGAQLQA